MSRSKNTRKGVKKGKKGKEYWKSRLHKQGEFPGRFTKKRTAKVERGKAKIDMLNQDSDGVHFHDDNYPEYLNETQSDGPDVISS